MTSVTDSRQDDQATLLSLLRRFHFGEPSAAAETAVPDGAILPALLHPYRDASTIRYEYPLYLAPADAGVDLPVALALTDHLAASVEAFAPGEDNAKILKDNLPWLERYFRDALTGPDLVDARGLFDEAAALMPEDPRPHYTLGHLYDREGRREEAAEMYRTARDLQARAEAGRT